MEAVLEFLGPLVEAYAGKLGFMLQLVSIIGTLRLLFKPIVSVVDVVVKLTPSKSDDNLASDIENNKVVKAILYVIDWLTSLKIVKK